MKANQRFRNDTSGMMDQTKGLLIGAVLIIAVLFIAGVLPPKGVPSAQSIGAPGGVQVVTVDTSATQAMQGKKAIDSYTARIVNARSGSFETAGTVDFYRATDDPSKATSARFTGISPNAATNPTIIAEEDVKVLYQSANSRYPVSRFGVADDKVQAGNFLELIPAGVTAATLTVVDTKWPFAYTVGTISDPIEENAPTGDQGFPQNPGALNGTTGWEDRPSVGVAAGTTNCIAVGADSSPGDGDTIFFNNTNCGGTFRIRFDCGTGSTSNSAIRNIAASVEDLGVNMTGDEVTTAVLSAVSGSGCSIPETDVTNQLNEKRTIALHAGTEEFIHDSKTKTLELSVTYDATNWAAGEGLRFRIDDNDKYNGFSPHGRTNMTGASSVNFVVARQTNDD